MFREWILIELFSNCVGSLIMCLCPDSPRLQILLEQWISCAGIWKESALYIRMSSKKAFKKRGCRAWLTFQQIAERYGSEDVARQITETKLGDEEARRSQVREHPDCPATVLHLALVSLQSLKLGCFDLSCMVFLVVFLSTRLNEDVLQFLVWIEDSEQEEEDTVVEQFFEAVDKDNDDRGRARSRSRGRSRGKSNKRKEKNNKKSKKKDRRKRSRSSTSKSSTSSSSCSNTSSKSSSKVCIFWTLIEINHTCLLCPRRLGSVLYRVDKFHGAYDTPIP